MKYVISTILSLALWAYFRREHTFTAATWAFLLLAHMPALLAMLALERKKIRIHPVVCFFIIWLGGFLFAGVFGKLMGLENKNEPNKAMEPTPVSVTVPAGAGPAPLTSAAHL